MSNIEIKNSIQSGNMSDLKIFLLCISSGAIGFSLISILPYEIPLFLRVSIAFLFLGIPLMDMKKSILFGIAGGLGFFIKDLVFWDMFSFKWISLYGTTIENSLLTGIIIGTFLSIVLWNRKAIEIFPLTTTIAFFTGPNLSYMVFFFLNLGFNPIQPDLGVGFVFGAGMCLYLLSINRTHSPLRSILLTIAILFICANVLFMIIFSVFSFGHPSYVGSTAASIGEAVEKEGTSIAVTNYAFMQGDNGKILKADIIIRNSSKVDGLRLHLWFRHDEYLGTDITLVTVGARHALNDEEIPGRPKGRLEAIGANSTGYYLYFENLPERVRTKDFAVVWEIWTRKGIEYVIWQTNSAG